MSDCKQNDDEGQGYQALSAVEGLLVTFVMNLRSGTIVGAHLLNPQHRPAFEGECYAAHMQRRLTRLVTIRGHSSNLHEMDRTVPGC
jgi:hypothetical protein